MTSPPSAWGLWRMPLLLAGLSLMGLIAALVADGVGDAAGSLCLAAPVLVAAWYGLYLPRRQHRRG